MTREEAIEMLKALNMMLRSPDGEPISDMCDALDMAIEVLSAEQNEEELAKDIARRMATIIENEQDMRVILKNASAESTDLISRAEAQTKLQMNAKRYTVAHESHGLGHVVWSDELIKVEDAIDILRNLPSADMRGEKRVND